MREQDPMREQDIVRPVVALCVLLLATLGILDPAVAAEEPGAGATFSVERDAGGVLVRAPDGKPVFRYMTKKAADSKLTANSVCCLHPVYTPAGEVVTAFAPEDHRHHRGVFLAWHTVHGKKGADFWGWGEYAPTDGRVIENVGIDKVAADRQRAELRIRNQWLVDGQPMIHEELLAAARRQASAHVIDLTYRLTPTGEVRLDRTAFGGFCFRSRKGLKATYSDPKGEVKRPNPHYLKPETNWPSADWYDLSIHLAEGKTIGMGVLDHPHNPPSSWHNLPPLWMVNPCITAKGPITLTKDKPLVLHYRLVAHDGPAPVELLRQLSDELRPR